MLDEAVVNPIRPLGAGEAVVRVADLDRSNWFYRDVLGFPLIRALQGSIAFLRVAAGVAGCTQVIELFRNERDSNAKVRRA
jgi:catechol 2,3-dioxygenase-like lactoylglutathione lyase family enzyme